MRSDLVSTSSTVRMLTKNVEIKNGDWEEGVGGWGRGSGPPMPDDRGGILQNPARRGSQSPRGVGRFEGEGPRRRPPGGRTRPARLAPTRQIVPPAPTPPRRARALAGR